MPQTLIVIEAPNKRAKLSHILGDDYNIQASVGHIMDLPVNRMGIDFDTFEPEYEVSDQKTDVV